MAQSGGSREGLNFKEIGRIKFMLPTDINEQQKIGGFFSKLDRQIELEEQKLAKLEEQKKGYMQKIFSQELRFKDEKGNDYPEWRKEIVGNIATTFSGGTPSSTNSNFYNGSIPFIRSGEIYKNSTELMINEQAISNSSAKIVKVGDLLYALYGATSGEVAISKINGAINQAVLCIRSQESVGYLFNYLKMKKDQILKTYIQGGQGNLSASIIKNIDIDLPDIKEQHKIGNFFNECDELIEKQNQKIDLLKERKKSFLQKMFI
ncbi:Type I restriction modification DNA specificity domain protein [Staphylococcus phage SpP]